MISQINPLPNPATCLAVLSNFRPDPLALLQRENMTTEDSFEGYGRQYYHQNLCHRGPLPSRCK